MTLILLLGGFSVHAQFFSVTGVIVDENDEPLPGATVISEETGYGATADTSGYYNLKVPKGTHHIKATFVGTEPIIKTINATRNHQIDFRLKPAIIQLDAFVKTGRSEDYRISEVPGVERMTITAIKDVPLLMGEIDIVNSITLLPGVTTVGEGASGFNVRGGKVDQNLVLINGAEVFNSSHLLGFFSIFNPDVVEDFTLYKGHVPAQFGGRISSVLDVNLREGDQQLWSGGITVGAVTSKFFVEGPIMENKLSLLAAGRFAYPNYTMHRISNYDVRQSDATFDDQNITIGYRLNDNNKITASFYRSGDKFKYSDDFEFNWNTTFGNIKVQNYLGSNLLHELEVNRVNYSNEQVDLVKRFAVNNTLISTSIRDYFLFDGFQGHELIAGVEGRLYEQSPEQRTPLSNSGFQSEQAIKDDGLTLSAFLNDNWDLADKLSLSMGIRYNHYIQTGDDQVFEYSSGIPSVSTITDTVTRTGILATYSNFEPRIGLNYRFTEQIAFKASYNQLAQFVHLISNTASPTPVNIWQVSTEYIEPQKSSNYSAGLTYQGSRKKWQHSVDFYYRDISSIYEYRDFAELILNPHVETELIQSIGQAYGTEVLIEKTGEGWTGWLSYTWSRALNRSNSDFGEEQINEGAWYPANYDQRHNFSLVLNRQMGRNGFLSFNVIYKSGRPFTAVVTNYNYGDYAVPVYSDRNQYNIPDYFRVDLGFGFNTVFKRFDDRINLSLYNLFGRSNVFSVFYQLPSDVAVVPHSYYLSILADTFPSLTYSINLNQKDEF